MRSSTVTAIISGESWAASWQRAVRLITAARHEVLGLVPSVSVASEWPADPAERVPGHHPAIRVVASDGILDDQCERMARVFGDLADMRICRYVPCLVVIADRQAAVLSRGREMASDDVQVVHSKAVIETLVNMFKHHWADATPAEDLARGRRLTDLQRILLQYLAAGVTDAVVARELLISTRTVQRHVTYLMRMFGARSRLELGVRLARLDALPLPAPRQRQG